MVASIGVPHQRASGALGSAGAGIAGAGAGAPGAAGVAGRFGISGAVGTGPPRSMIERGPRSVWPSSTSRMLVAKNAAPRIAVVRVKQVGRRAPGHEAGHPAAPHAERAALALLQHHDPDQRDRDQHMNNEQQDDHGAATAAISGIASI